MQHLIIGAGDDVIGFVHPLIALGWQGALYLLTGNWWYGVATSVFFVGRELTQAEYRWIEKYGAGLRANMPWYDRFDPRVWDVHSLTDWILPVLLTLAVALLL